MFLAPAIIYVVLFFGYPVFKNVIMGSQDYTTKTFFTGEAPWVGITNYVSIFSRSLFSTALINTALFTVGSILGQFIIGLALALFFRRRFPLNNVLRSLLLLPWPARALEVVASFTVLADMVREVGGDRVRVTSLVRADGDPHAYEPSPDDARTLRGADVVVINGLGLEGWMTRLIAASGTRAVPVAATARVPARRMQEDGKTVDDPHAWNSVANAPAYVASIAAALVAADPAGTAAYQANATRYTAELQALDAYVRQQVGAVPPGRRKVLMSHDAFGYFAAAYGVTVLSPVGLSTEAEASARGVAALRT